MVLAQLDQVAHRGQIPKAMVTTVFDIGLERSTPPRMIEQALPGSEGKPVDGLEAHHDISKEHHEEDRGNESSHLAVRSKFHPTPTSKLEIQERRRLRPVDEEEAHGEKGSQAK